MADEIANLSKRFDNLLNTVSHRSSASPKFEMPSYNSQSHLPPTPPECWPYYSNGVPHGHQFLSSQDFRPSEKSTVDSYRGFSNTGAFQFEPAAFESRADSLFASRQQTSYHGIPPPGITHPNNHWYGAVALPPPQKRVELPPIDGTGFDRQMYQVRCAINNLYSNLVPDKKQQSHVPRRHRQEQRKQEQAAARPVEEKPVGGVSAHLDYDMEEMTEFVGHVAQQLYVTFPRNYSRGNSNIIFRVNPMSVEAQERVLSRDTRKFVLQILSSTRLPSSTILLGLVYLKERMAMLNPVAPSRDPLFFHRMLTIALLLASKFLDDNTFQNKSWSEVTGLPVIDLNALEKTWLEEIGWHLHVDPEGTKGFSQYKLMWDAYRKSGSKAPAPALAPINTNIRRHHRQSPSTILTPDLQNMWNHPSEYTMSSRKSYELMTPAETVYPETSYYSHHSDVGGDRLPIQLPPPQPQHRQHESSGYWAHVIEAHMEYSSVEYSPPSAPETGPPTPVEYGHAWPGSAGFPSTAVNPSHQSSSYSRLPPPVPSYHQHMGQTWRPPFCGYAYGQRTESYLMASFGQPVTA